MHALHGGGSLHLAAVEALELCQLLVGEDERTDGSMRTNVGALVTLDTVLLVPDGHEGFHAALLVGGCANLPGAVGGTELGEGADGQQVAGLSVDGTNHLLDECGSVVLLLSVVGQLSPCGIHSEGLVLVAAIHGSVVLVHHVFALGAVALDDELLHLLHSELHGDDACNAEEGRLQDGVRAVAETDFLSNLGGVDGIDGDVVLCEVALHLVGHELGQFLALEDGVEEERAAVLQTACDIVHVEVSLNVASHEVRRGHEVRGADGRVAEAQV